MLVALYVGVGQVDKGEIIPSFCIQASVIGAVRRSTASLRLRVEER